MTLILSDARAMVGVRVTPRSGSTSTATRGSVFAASLTAVSGSDGSMPSAVSSDSGSGLSSSEGWRSRIACSSGASFVSALSPIRGIDAWPASPWVVSVKRKTPFSATHPPPVEVEDLAGALVDHVVAPDLVGVLVAEPLRAELRARLLVCRDHDEQLAARPPALLGERRGGHYLRGDLALHVERAAAPDAVVLELARPRVDRPVRGIGEHGVHVTAEAEDRAVTAAGQPCDQIGTPLDRREQLALEARGGERVAQEFLGRRSEERRVGKECRSR